MIDCYCKVSVCLLILSSFSVSKYVYLRFFDGIVSFLVSDIFVKFLIFLYASFIFSVGVLFSDAVIPNVISSLLGVILGFSQLRLEKMFFYASRRRKLSIGGGEDSLIPRDFFLGKLESTSGAMASSSSSRSFFLSSKVFESNVVVLVSIAILEEFLYRGYFFTIICFFSSFLWVKFLSIIVAAFIFSFSHLSYSFELSCFRFFFSLFLQGVFIFSHSVLGCVVAHSILNVCAWFEIKHAQK